MDASDGGSAMWWVISQWVLLCAAPTVVLYAVFHAGRMGRWVQRAFRRVRPRPVTPVGPPLERIVADLHRIARIIEALPPRVPLARRQGAILAYDDALGAACRALGVEDSLRGLPFGARRDAARIHVEAELACAGLVLAPPRAA